MFRFSTFPLATSTSACWYIPANNVYALFLQQLNSLIDRWVFYKYKSFCLHFFYLHKHDFGPLTKVLKIQICKATYFPGSVRRSSATSLVKFLTIQQFNLQYRKRDNQCRKFTFPLMLNTKLLVIGSNVVLVVAPHVPRRFLIGFKSELWAGESKTCQACWL